jgi:predicted dehydrogenase
MVSAPLNIGIIGLGFGSRVHLPAFRRDPRCRVAAIAGSNAEKAMRVAHQLSIETSYGDWRPVLDDRKIDAVSIAVPPFQQPAIAQAALEAGKHVFCEKPLAANASQAASLLEAASRTQIAHAINFIFPELPLWVRARELIGGNKLGKIRHAVLDWRAETHASKTKTQSWKNDPKQGGGVLNNFVSHVVHNIEWLFGKAEGVTAALRGSSSGGETCAQATVDTEAGFPVFLSVSSDAFLGHGHLWSIYGEEGTVVLENRTADYASGFELSVGTRLQRSLQVIERDEPQAGVDGRIAPVARLVSRFLDSIIDQVPMSPNFTDGFRAQLILDEMRASNQVNRRHIGDSTRPQ